MFFKKRKFPVAAFLLVCSLFLSACLSDIELKGFFTPFITSEASQTVSSEEVLPKSPLLYCKVGRGTVLFGRKWYSFKDSSFSIYQGERTRIKIIGKRNKKEREIQIFFDKCGQKMVFCPVTDFAQGKRISCASMYALKEDLEQGIKRTFNVPSVIRDGTISCAFLQEKMKSLAIPPSRGR